MESVSLLEKFAHYFPEIFQDLILIRLVSFQDLIAFEKSSKLIYSVLNKFWKKRALTFERQVYSGPLVEEKQKVIFHSDNLHTLLEYRHFENFYDTITTLWIDNLTFIDYLWKTTIKYYNFSSLYYKMVYYHLFFRFYSRLMVDLWLARLNDQEVRDDRFIVDGLNFLTNLQTRYPWLCEYFLLDYQEEKNDSGYVYPIHWNPEFKKIIRDSLNPKTPFPENCPTFTFSHILYDDYDRIFANVILEFVLVDGLHDSHVNRSSSHVALKKNQRVLIYFYRVKLGAYDPTKPVFHSSALFFEDDVPISEFNFPSIFQTVASQEFDFNTCFAYFSSDFFSRKWRDYRYAENSSYGEIKMSNSNTYLFYLSIQQSDFTRRYGMMDRKSRKIISSKIDPKLNLCRDKIIDFFLWNNNKNNFLINSKTNNDYNELIEVMKFLYNFLIDEIKENICFETTPTTTTTTTSSAARKYQIKQNIEEKEKFISERKNSPNLPHVQILRALRRFMNFLTIDFLQSMLPNNIIFKSTISESHFSTMWPKSCLCFAYNIIPFATRLLVLLIRLKFPNLQTKISNTNNNTSRDILIDDYHNTLKMMKNQFILSDKLIVQLTNLPSL